MGDEAGGQVPQPEAQGFRLGVREPGLVVQTEQTPGCHEIDTAPSADRKNNLPLRQRHPALRNVDVLSGTPCFRLAKSSAGSLMG